MTMTTGASRIRSSAPIDPGVSIGHVHLKVADLDRALGVLLRRARLRAHAALRPSAAFVSAGGYHHHIGLNTWESHGGSPPPPGTTGLYHVAIVYPTRAALADALRRAGRRRHSARRRQRPRGQRSALPARPRRQRHRALLGSPERPVAAHRRRRARDVHASARPAVAARSGIALRSGIARPARLKAAPSFD